ncbi:MAG TPA: DUF6660 family protein [Daejeonella sp.]
MKFLCAIFSVYVMLMSVMTCKDGFVMEKSKTQVVLAQDTDHAETPSDLCSPFCTCTCCVGCTQPSITVMQAAVSIPTDLSDPYIEKDLLKNPHGLFQPPKVQG